MTHATEQPVLLFSYGTLQDPAVQLSTFGRELKGRADSLPGTNRTGSRSSIRQCWPRVGKPTTP